MNINHFHHQISKTLGGIALRQVYLNFLDIVDIINERKGWTLVSI